jgi:azurin
MRTSLTFLMAATLACAACNNEKPSGDTTAPSATAAPAPTTEAKPAPSAAASATAAPAPKVEVLIASTGNLMAFDKKTLSVPAGAEVHLVLKNNGTLETMSHNWVLVKPGTEAKVAAEGLDKAPDAGYVVEGENVLAHTPLAPPGKTTEVTFTAPAAGTYPYICTFPGHYVMMKGVLTVTP